MKNFYIHAGGRWRRVTIDGEHLRVEGRRTPAWLVSKRGGVLKRERPSHVLNRLRTGPPLAEVEPSRKLSLIKKKYDKKRPVTMKDACIGTDHETWQEPRRVLQENIISTEERRSNPGYSSQANGKFQLSKSPLQQNVIAKNSPQKSTITRTGDAEKENILLSDHDIDKEKRKLVRTSSVETVKLPPLKNSNVASRKNSLSVDSDSESSEHSEDSDGSGKKLIISEEDVAVLRQYILTHVTKIDLHLFDSDMHYKKQVFYKINPMVRIVRCPIIAQMLQEKSKQAASAFARRLGLCSVNGEESKSQVKACRPRKKVASIRSSTESDSDASVVLQKMPTTKDPWKKASNPVRRSKDSDSSVVLQKMPSRKRDEPPKENHKSSSDTKSTEETRQKKNAVTPREKGKVPAQLYKSSCVRPGREYSPMEDQTIIALLTVAQERERAVSGNRVWKELVGQYRELAGKKRSWQSLRGRYLHYIIPQLHQIVDSQTAKRLRANFATGDLVQKKKLKATEKLNHTNSLLKLPTVQSAMARRCKTKTDDSPSKLSRDERNKRQRSPDQTKEATTLSHKADVHVQPRSRDNDHHDKSPNRRRVGGSELSILMQEAKKISKHPERLSRLRKRSIDDDSGEEFTPGKEYSRIKKTKHNNSPNKRLKRSMARDRSESNESVKRFRSRSNESVKRSERRKGDNNKNEKESSPLSYSQITKRFATRKLRSTPRKSDGSSAVTSPVKKSPRKGRRLYNAAVPT